LALDNGQETNRMKKWFAFACAIGMLLAASVAPAQITNGSFELTPSRHKLKKLTTYSSASQGIPGWTIVSGDVDLVTNALWPAFDGKISLDLNGTGPGAIQQTFATSIGQTYNLTFAYSNDPDGPGDQDDSGNRSDSGGRNGSGGPGDSDDPGNSKAQNFTANVTVTGVDSNLATTITHNSSTYNTKTNTGSMNYTLFSENFVADSNSTTLQFMSTVPDGGSGIVLDKVGVTAVTPEFGAVFSLGGLLAAGGLGLWVKRRRAK
jgi:hypothetical protein